MKREQIIEILKKHQHSMAGHTWLIGLDESDFILIADDILASHPEQPQEQKQTEVEILKKVCKYKDDEEFTLHDDITTEEAIEAMELYASQSQSVLPSEEECERVFEYYHPAKDEDEKKVCMKVIKWFKSQLKQGYPKEFVEHLVEIAEFNKDIDGLYQYWLTIKDK